jgi:hypothetical protein
MDLNTVIENLDRTITGKEVLKEYYAVSKHVEHKTVVYLIEINIDELKRIREDLIQVKLSMDPQNEYT